MRPNKPKITNRALHMQWNIGDALDTHAELQLGYITLNRNIQSSYDNRHQCTIEGYHSESGLCYQVAL